MHPTGTSPQPCSLEPRAEAAEHVASHPRVPAVADSSPSFPGASTGTDGRAEGKGKPAWPPSPVIPATKNTRPVAGLAVDETSQQPLQSQNKSKSKWNTQKLGWRVASDAVAAAAAGVLVAPLITAIDRGIIENASGRNTLGGSIRSSLHQLLLRPQSFVFSKPFGLIFSLYFGTYLTANTIDTIHSSLPRSALPPSPTRASHMSSSHSRPATPDVDTTSTTDRSLTHTTSGLPKFFATSTANLTLCLYKDSRFTQLFASPSRTAPRPVPLPTYLLFTIRDCLTIFASFNLPPLLAPHIPPALLPTLFGSAVSQCTAAQFLAPAGIQLLSTPLHLLGLDLYNHRREDIRKGETRSRIAFTERARRVAGLWLPSCAARMARIVPAFGVGGVVNGKVRLALMGKLE